MHIVIAGNIGSGKTTLTNLLAHHYGWEPRFEQVEFIKTLSFPHDEIFKAISFLVDEGFLVHLDNDTYQAQQSK